jgi:hypothetical protein
VIATKRDLMTLTMGQLLGDSAASPLASGEQSCGTKRAWQASLFLVCICIDSKTQNTRHFNLTQPDLK